jgi:hypothetical protein
VRGLQIMRFHTYFHVELGRFRKISNKTPILFEVHVVTRPFYQAGDC